MRGLLVVDMQNGFCDPKGSVPSTIAPVENIDVAVRGCVAAVSAARAAGIQIIFTRHQYRPGYADAGRNFAKLGTQIQAVGGLLAGSWDAAVLDVLGPRESEFFVDKSRYDAFLNTNLATLLRGAGIEDLLVCGVATNVCVESTIRSAYAHDFQVGLLVDACAGWTAQLHDASVEVLTSSLFAEARSVSDGCLDPVDDGGPRAVEVIDEPATRP